jgi:hypothetical protein
MPECQDDFVFSILLRRLALTTLFLAYQMPSDRISSQEGRARSLWGAQLAARLTPAQAGWRRKICEIKNDFKEEANVEFQRCGPQDS